MVARDTLQFPLKRRRADLWPLIAIAAVTVVAHCLTGGRYGFHRDELATLDDARHLAWGYVAYPPVTPFFGWLSLHLFGTSLTGFRFFASFAGAIAIILAGLIARELGGGRGAQLLAACATAPVVLAIGTLMQYVSFDYLAWVAAAYFVARLCRSNDPRWWLAIGAAIGFGMLSKYSMPFLVAGIAVGVLSSGLRQQLQSRWMWLGAAVALLIFLPNFLWQWRHDFISLQFLGHIHGRDVRIGRTRAFLPDQLEIAGLALPLAFVGIYFYLLTERGRNFRVLGWMFLVPVVLFILGKGRGYYLAPAYPMLYAGGAVLGETWLQHCSRGWRTAIATLAFAAMLASSAIIASYFLPIAPVNSSWWKKMVQNNGDLSEEIGWEELVENLARIRDSLPPEDRAQVKIFCGNYGEAGAINLYGPRHGLPPAICLTNSFWERGYGDPPPELLIVLGSSARDLEGEFDSCELVGHITNREGVANEETSDHPDIFLCRHLRRPWPEVWKKNRRFG
jgi:4-amino-4-deoxy-L-arabinose transferase-like glycosyltransferase